MDEIKRRFPDEPILVVRYGDHQPSATRDIINDVWGDDSPDIGPDGSPGPFITFYAIEGHNVPVPPLPAYDPLDIAYVGTIMLEAAGLPLSASQLERKRLMMACEGRYFGCEPRSQILAFHRRLITCGRHKSSRRRGEHPDTALGCCHVSARKLLHACPLGSSVR